MIWTNKTSIHYYLLVVILYSIILACSTSKSINGPNNLSVSEGFTNPIGFYDDTPTFSWKLPKDAMSQSAYHIVVASSPDLLPNHADLWDSRKVKSDESLFIKYQGSKLKSRQKAYWQVKYWDGDSGKTEWSKVAFFELGLLDNNDWEAKWLSLPNMKADSLEEIKRKIYKVQYLRKDIDLERNVEKARWYISAKGLYEAYINGIKISNDVLAPGWTPYEQRIETKTYDVTDLVKNGENAIGLILAEGWHSGRLLFRDYSGVPTSIIAQLEITYTDGTSKTFQTDKTWKASTNGPIEYSSIYDGEFYDATKEMPMWSHPDFDDSNWSAVVEESISDDVLLRPKSHNPIIQKATLTPIEITEPTKGNVVFDLGQNMAGVPQINIPVKKGQRVKIRVAEMLQPTGEIYTDNYRGALSTDYYTPSADGNITWQPTFTFHGFRYVELSGFDESAEPTKSWVKGIVLHSDFEQSGQFTSSHDKLNQLQSNIEWGLRGNFLDIPTDCPQRNERLGWTGDAQVFVPTSLFIADVHAFWSSWMRSVREDQMDDGGIPFYVPHFGKDRASSGWGDAITIIPWEIYQRTGDVKVLLDNYPAMRKWLDFYKSKATDHIVRMFTFGDWLQPYSQNPKNKKIGETDVRLLSTAYYARSIEITRQTAEAIGQDTEAAELKILRDEVRSAFQQKFFNPDGSISVGKPTQTGYLMAIGFGLLTPEMEEKAIPHLIQEIKNADNHLRTGFLGTPLLAPVLEHIGRSDLMFQILFKETYPSWFYSINQGATTMWERWDSYTHEDGFHKEGMNSFNHYAYGAIGQWMYERIAGITPMKPGYKYIKIAPLLGGPLTSAAAEYESPYGLIKSSWKLNGSQFTFDATVPPNTSAKLIIPGDSKQELLLDGKSFMEDKNISIILKNPTSFELQVGPGDYHFSSTLNQ